MTGTHQVEPVIPIADPDLGAAERRRVADVLASARLSGGPEVAGFGEDFADYCGADHAVPTANGTAALHAALAALGVGHGDAVVTTPFTFVATANAIRHVGAEPVFADVDPATYDLDPAAVADVVRTRDDVAAIVAVHLYGLPAAMEPLGDLAAEHDLHLIEDAAQAHGATYRCDPVGAIGDVGCFSFYPTKNMTAGEGGAVVTDDDAVASALERYVDHGRTGDGEFAEVGHNFRMSDVCAAIGRAQLDRLDEQVAIRRRHAGRYDAAITGDDPVPPTVPVGRDHAYNQYTVRTEDRPLFREHMRRYGVETAVYYPKPVHHHRAYADVTAETPVASRAAEEVVSLPVHPGLSEEAVDTICRALAEWKP